MDTAVISPLNPKMFSRFVGIDEKSFILNAYAEELQQFEELLQEYGKDPNCTPSKQKVNTDYFTDLESALFPVLANTPQINSDMVLLFFNFHRFKD